MAHDHSHTAHTVEPENLNRAFIVGITLNFLFVLIEAVTGFAIHSLSLLSDAGHNLADVAMLALSLLAYRLLRVRSNEQYTYGYSRTSILVALFNSAVLLVSIGAIAYEAIHRFFAPEPLPGGTIAIVAGIGIVINSATALMFTHGKNKDVNVKSAYIHLLSDAFVSLGLVIGGIAIYYTGWYWLDPALGLGIAVTILFSAWGLLRESLRLSLDAVPENISIEDLRSTARTIAGVKDLHHIHVWTISTAENAMTAHLVLAQETTTAQEQKIKNELKHELLEKSIHHVTLESERENENCETEEH
ncbi:MAG TPA: cation diffusion facilitator family transporter [Candidatus Kapabacteria bacterium]|nr:cation diffusion facilitator family transporter [Candidatus Kapabacteria bacterium]